MQSRYVSINQYQKITGLSYPTIKNAAETGKIKAIQTEAGHWKIDTAADTSVDITALLERLDGQEKLLKSLCAHLGVKL